MAEAAAVHYSCSLHLFGSELTVCNHSWFVSVSLCCCYLRGEVARGTYRSTEECQHMLRQVAVLRLLRALNLCGRGRPLQMSDRDSVQLLAPAQRTWQGEPMIRFHDT